MRNVVDAGFYIDTRSTEIDLRIKETIFFKLYTFVTA